MKLRTIRLRAALPLCAALLAVCLLGGRPAFFCAQTAAAATAETAAETATQETAMRETPDAEEPARPTPQPTPSAAVLAAARQAEETLTAYLDGLGGGVSVYCVRLTDGCCYEYNADAEYYAASLLKAPYALWLCQRADAGELDLTAPLGSWLGTPVRSGREAIAAMISVSDNDAAGQLYHTWPAAPQGPFADFLAGLGIDRPDSALTDATAIQGVVSARDMGKLLQAMAAYFETDSENAAALQAAMLDADHSLLQSDWPMAKKYGSWAYALHDMAIVYADAPYCIAVLSAWGDEAVAFPQPGADRIAEIGRLAETLMEIAPPLPATPESAAAQ